MTESPFAEWTARHALKIGVAAVVGVAVPIGVMRGSPAVVLWVGFALLAAAAVLFWETIRLLLDRGLPGDFDAGEDDGFALAALEERKRTAMQALRDLDFERSIGRLGDEDHRALELRYREEARAAMKALDEGIGPWRGRAEKMVRAACGEDLGDEKPEAKGGGKSKGKSKVAAKGSAKDNPKDAAKADPAAVTAGTCGKCATANDVDAVFCKRCGERIAQEVEGAR